MLDEKEENEKLTKKKKKCYLVGKKKKRKFAANTIDSDSDSEMSALSVATVNKYSWQRGHDARLAAVVDFDHQWR